MKVVPTYFTYRHIELRLTKCSRSDTLTILPLFLYLTYCVVSFSRYALYKSNLMVISRLIPESVVLVIGLSLLCRCLSVHWRLVTDLRPCIIQLATKYGPAASMQEYVSAKDSVKNPKKRCGSIAALRTYASGAVGTSLTSRDGWSPHRYDRAYLGIPTGHHTVCDTHTRNAVRGEEPPRLKANGRLHQICTTLSRRLPPCFAVIKCPF
jgi:hypothetical protein